MFLLIRIAACSNLHCCMSLSLKLILVIPTLFASAIFPNIAQSFHNHSQDNHKILSINNLNWQKQVVSWTVVILMQLKLFDPAIALVINLGTYFLDTPQWDLFLFLMFGAIKCSSQMIFNIFDLFMLSSYNYSKIFNKGELLISQHNFTASAEFLEYLLLFQALF